MASFNGSTPDERRAALARHFPNLSRPPILAFDTLDPDPDPAFVALDGERHRVDCGERTALGALLLRRAHRAIGDVLAEVEDGAAEQAPDLDAAALAAYRRAVALYLPTLPAATLDALQLAQLRAVYHACATEQGERERRAREEVDRAVALVRGNRAGDGRGGNGDD